MVYLSFIGSVRLRRSTSVLSLGGGCYLSVCVWGWLLRWAPTESQGVCSGLQFALQRVRVALFPPSDFRLFVFRWASARSLAVDRSPRAGSHTACRSCRACETPADVCTPEPDALPYVFAFFTDDHFTGTYREAAVAERAIHPRATHDATPPRRALA